MSLKDRLLGKPMEVDRCSTSASRWRMPWPPATPRESSIATSSRPTSSSPTSGQVKILDFGLAKVGACDCGGGGRQEDLTVAGEIFGTAVYMSPEQARGEELDPAYRSVLPGRRALPDGDRQEALCRDQCGDHAGRRPEPEAGLSSEAEPGAAPGPGGHPRPRDGKGPGQPLSERAGHEGRPAVAEAGNRARHDRQRAGAAGFALPHVEPAHFKPPASARPICCSASSRCCSRC